MTHKTLDPEKVRHDEDYEVHWNYTSFKDKVILDLGADEGSTTSWFFGKGAKRVIAVECNEASYNQLAENYKGDNDVIPVKMKVDSKEKFTELITLFTPDMVKMDIERDEIRFAEVQPNVAKLPNEYLIEAHNPHIKDGLFTYFTSLNPFYIAIYDVLNIHIIHVILRDWRMSNRCGK